ncbi:hypothetical protein [Sphingopyxis sp. GW247-27LB]|uniref:hypothetical protein n=1 Tax=Sphingopyxis sp. GW247-27LB TaxID=2012632 RepID=UPI000BA53B1E|nr:hypothetical protein [Sphingopyxis sp. GW247-27LB]PAL24539.1 hypothetical protein CD928_03835 [Sphingopyxis sp. GW247-27LB]
MTINWGILDPNAAQRGAEMSQAIFDRFRADRVRGATGAALQELMADPNAAPASLNALARLAPDAAAHLVQFQQARQDRSRETQFRNALADYYGAGAGMNALMPQRPIAGQATEPPPPISDAPPPPADWRARIGRSGVDAALSTANVNGATANNMPDVPVTSGRAMVPVDPNAMLPDDMQADMTGQSPQADTPLPPEIERAANSPDPNARNAAFRRMMQIDPVQAMKIQSEEREHTLDAMEDSVKAFRWASEALSNAGDDATYKQILARVEQATAPLGIDIRSMVPGTHPGPEGIRQLQLQALDISQRLAAIDRRFTAEARIADIEADNERQDRNTESLIRERERRTGIAQQRAETSASRERRLSAGSGKRGGNAPAKVKPGEPVAVGPDGSRMVVRGGQWVPAQ